jgi:tetratricopeptide (TPR) repeat protein
VFSSSWERILLLGDKEAMKFKGREKMGILIKSYEILNQGGWQLLYSKIIERRKNRKFYNYIIQRRWKEAAIQGESLAQSFPEKILYHQWLARCYMEVGKHDLAAKSLRRGLELRMSLEELIKRLEAIQSDSKIPEPKYVCLGGEQNLGGIEYSKFGNGGLKKYLTKISTVSGSEKEKLFYQQIYKFFPKIREITPELINFMDLKDENLALITMEKIEGNKPDLSKKLIRDVITASKKMSSIRYGLIKDCVPEPDFEKDFILFYDIYPKHPINALHSFISIHRKETNDQLFDQIYRRMGELGYSADCYKLFKRLESYIFDLQLFNRINPKIHYSLQHGDFNIHNMLFDEKRGKLYIIDWGNMRVGPSWVDIAGFLGHNKLPFNVIEEEFLQNTEAISDFDPFEKLFFIYTLIVTWFIVFTRGEFEQNLDLYVRPAVEKFESILSEISNEDKGQ